MMVVEVTGGEGGQRLTVQGVRGGGACLDDVAFVQLELDFAGHILLGGFHEGLYSFPQGGEPFAFIYDLSHLVAHVFFDFHGGTV